MKALVVDDSLTIRLVLQEVLSKYAEVSCCADGEEAVEACARALAAGEPFHLICLDIIMPNMNGLEALKLIRQEEERHLRPRASKVIITTASDDDDNIRTAFRELCDAYVRKPIDVTEFLGVAEFLCGLPAPPPRVAGAGSSENVPGRDST